MKKDNLSINRILNILYIILLFLQFGCSKSYDKMAPELPPNFSIYTNFSDFKISSASISNWNYAAMQVTRWSSMNDTLLAIPVEALQEATQHEPILQETNKWLWTYPFGEKKNYSAKLYATVNNKNVEWEMHISKTGDYTDFLWYAGKSNFDGINGSWVLNKTPNENIPFLSIIWNKNSATTFDIKYKVILPNDIRYGNYIFYNATNNENLNTYLNIYNVKEDNLIEIQYNKVNKNGHVKDPIKYADKIWHCWDITLQDIDCIP